MRRFAESLAAFAVAMAIVAVLCVLALHDDPRSARAATDQGHEAAANCRTVLPDGGAAAEGEPAFSELPAASYGEALMQDAPPVQIAEPQSRPDIVWAEEMAVSSTMSNLKVMRSQLMLYRVQHGEAYPTDLVRQLTLYTNAEGQTSEVYTNEFRFGPYLLRLPPNPVTGQTTVFSVADPEAQYVPAPDMNQGWWYNSATGEFRCDAPDHVLTFLGEPVNSL
ncbi:MAG: hypothetical protein JXL80_05980 [Planctomycetes bacterium]|nr:hypothetical protein [Planctomycetota bacterium]